MDYWWLYLVVFAVGVVAGSLLDWYKRWLGKWEHLPQPPEHLPVLSPAMSTVKLPDGGGKTTLAIEESARTGAVIACRSHAESDRVKQAAKCMGLDIPDPITHEELFGLRWRGRKISAFIIDNAEDIPNICINHVIAGVPVIMRTERLKRSVDVERQRG